LKGLKEMSNFLQLAYAFVRRDFFTATSYKFNFIFQLTAGFFIVAFFYFLSLLMDSETSRKLMLRFQSDYFSFVLIGVAATGLLQTGLSGFAERLRTGMTEGSLEMTFSCPVRPIWILVLPCVWAFFFEALKAIVVVAMGVVVFGANLSNANFWWAAVVVLFTITSFSVFGLLSASVIMVLKRGDPINVAFTAASSLIAGAYFPVELLPSWLGGVAKALPMPYAYDALRKTLLSGGGLSDIRMDLAVLAGFSLIGLPLAIGAAQYAIGKAKRDGTLGVF